jgi:hypothetical protein
MELFRKRPFWGLLVLVLWTGCESPSNKNAIQAQWVLQLEEILLQLDSLQPQVQVWRATGQDTTYDLEHFNQWHKTFPFFAAATLSADAEQNGYVKQLEIRGADSLVAWTAEVPKPRLRRLMLVFERGDGRLRKVEVSQHTNNFFYESAQELSFEAGSFLEIKGSSRLRWSKQQAYWQKVVLK